MSTWNFSSFIEADFALQHTRRFLQNVHFPRDNILRQTLQPLALLLGGVPC
jgi:hypothetical protein